MENSKVIEFNGVFLGAAVAVRGKPGWRVVAANARVQKAAGIVAETFQEAAQLARQAYCAAA